MFEIMVPPTLIGVVKNTLEYTLVLLPTSLIVNVVDPAVVAMFTALFVVAVRGDMF